jgi:serine O-acetyltransferase
MIVTSKKMLRFCMMADRMMNTGSFRRSFSQWVKELLSLDLRMSYLVTMRKLSYYKYKHHPLWLYYHYKYLRLSVKLGYTIGPDVFGYGLLLPHFGTIVVGPKNTIGNYAVMHVCSLITSTNKQIGNSLFVSTGAKITTCKRLGENVTIAANSVVTKPFVESNILLAGMPAVVKSARRPWWQGDEPFASRHQSCEELRLSMFGATDGQLA